MLYYVYIFLILLTLVSKEVTMDTIVVSSTLSNLSKDFSEKERIAYNSVFTIYIKHHCSFPTFFIIPYHGDFSMEDLSAVLLAMDKKHMYSFTLLGKGCEICIVRYG